MLGKGLESLIPKKDNGSFGEEPREIDYPNHTKSLNHPDKPSSSQGPYNPDFRPADSIPNGEQTKQSFPLNERVLSNSPFQQVGNETNQRDEQAGAPSDSAPVAESPSEKNPLTFSAAFPKSLVEKEEVNKIIKPSVDHKLPFESVFQIEVDKIKPNPHQPRRYFDEQALRELASSIREFGVIQPLIVSKIEEENETGTSVSYELIAGERRLLASKMVGLYTVPAIIRKPPRESEKLELAIIENIQRADLSPIEMARAFARLQDEFRLTQREIAAKLGKSREVVANSVRLLNLPSEIQEAIGDGRVNESQARLLLAIDDIPSQRRLFEEILKDNLSVREIKNRVKRIKFPETSERENDERTSADPEIDFLKEQLEGFLGTKIDLSRAGEGGKITINFYSPEELKAIAEKLLRNP